MQAQARVAIRIVFTITKSEKLQFISCNRDDEHCLASVDLNCAPSVHAVSTELGGWERIPVKIDSGAIDTVMPPTVAGYFKIQETPLSRNGPGFRAANGTPIKHLGQRILKGYGDEFQSLSLTAQVAEVSTTLGSVNQMLKAGSRVHFETGNSYIEHVRTGRRTKIEEKNDTFEVGVWVPRASFQRQDGAA